MMILLLSSPEATLERVGGKGANLSELARNDFPVPPGFLITTDAYRAFVTANRIGERILALAKQVAPDDPPALEQVAAEIRSLFTQGETPANIADQILRAYQDLTSASADGATEAAHRNGAAIPVAVRSSATAEDLPGLSFAGQQDTLLNVVGAEALLEAVKQCWSSLWTARAIGYRARNRIAPDDVALAVVVQRLIPSEVSGVLFTANPLTGRRAEFVIDASFGLGEAIVAGQVEPDQYVVDPRTWSITARKIGAKALEIVPQAGGGTTRIDRAAAGQALPDEQIIALSRLAQRVADHFGAPQDLEWAWAGGRLWLLQSRPITSLYPLPQRADEGGATALDASRDLRVYFSFNSVQGVTDPLTPIGRDVLQIALKNIFPRLGIQKAANEILYVAGGRLFVDVTEFIRNPRLRRVWFTVLSNADPGARQTITQLIDEGRIVPEAVRSRRSVANVIARLGRVRRIARTLVPVLGRVLAAYRAPEYGRARLIVEADRYLEQVQGHIRSTTTLEALLDALEAGTGRLVEQVLLRIAPVILPSVVMLGLVDRWLGTWLGLKRGSALALLRGLPGNVTTEMDLRLWALTQTIRADQDARAAFAQPVAALAVAYQRAALPPVAQGGIERFLNQYGMRAVAEIDLGRPRWRDDPTPVLQIIDSYLQLDDPDLAPDRQFERGAAEAERLAAEYIARVRRTRWGALRARLLGVAIRRIRLLAGLRETPKFYMIRMLDMYRTALIAHGRDLAARGLLERAEDIFFVPLAELRRYVRGEACDLHAIAAAQRADYERELTRRNMPNVLLSTGEAFYGGVGEAQENDLVGDAVSPGVIEGRVRVVREPYGVRLEPGEILVCPATDPGWTPLFLTAGGLVMELGGMITHGSVVAREYGIPAVVGVQQATTRLRTGQRVRVDGVHGRVTLLEEAPA